MIMNFIYQNELRDSQIPIFETEKSEFVSGKVGKKRIMKIIAIAAVTAGGKTTIVNEIKQQIKNVKSLHFDDYSFNGEVDDLVLSQYSGHRKCDFYAAPSA